MIRRCFHEVLLVWLGCAGLVGPAQVGMCSSASLTTGKNGDAVERVPTDSRPEYRITHWTAENGLPQNSIKALAQTRDGYLWIGTLKGLVRFDGVRFKVFDHNNTPEMKEDAINDLALDAADGGLWIGTGDGLLRYQDHRFERYGAERGFRGGVGNFCPAQSGGVWFSPGWGQVGLARAGSVQLREFGPDLPDNAVYQLGEEASDQLLAILANGHVLYRIGLNTKSVARVNVPIAGPACHSLFQDTDESLWLCRDDGIWHGSGVAWTRVAMADVQAGPCPERIYRASDGQVWVTQIEANRRNLCRLASGRLERFQPPEFSAGLNVTRLLEDQEGNLWVGSATGLFRLEPKRLRVYSRRDGLRNDDTQAVAEGVDGTIWVGTAEGISGIRDGKPFDLPVPTADTEQKKVTVLLADRQNVLWIGWRDHYLARFEQGRWQRVHAPPELVSAADLKALFEDREGRIWIGGSDRGAFCIDRGRTQVTTTNSLSQGDVRVIYQDRRGDLWFGTYGGGLICRHEGKFTAYKTGRGDLNNRAWWIHEDADGVFWVGSEDGLNRFVPAGAEPSRKQKAESRNGQTEGRFFTFTTQHGLGENVVNNIQEDDYGCLWLSGLHGIYRVPRQQLNEVAAGQRATVECVAYGEADGMLNSECNGGDSQPAGCKDRQGRIWFPTVQGVVMIDPKEMQRTELAPPVAIEQVVVANGEVVFGDGCAGGGKNIEHRTSNIQPRMQIKPGQGRVLEIHYTANSLRAPERVAFKYRLEGHDRDWLWDDQNRRVAFYTNLRPGNYTFHVTARSPHGVWNEQGGQISFHLAPHFYETWPFYVLCAVLVIGTAAGVQAYRLSWQGRTLRAQQVTVLAEERARIARDLHDDLGASLTGLALQLEAAQRRGGAAAGQLESLAGETRSLAHELRELAWTTNPRCDNTGSLVAFIGELTERYCQAAGLECRLDLPAGENSGEVPARVRHELVAVVKESLTNAAKHSGAREVTVGLKMNDGHLYLTIKDDGRGFDPARASAGSGLQNLRERVQQVGGSFAVATKPGAGTTVTTTVPLHST
jgi:signal transduction histidine kinase/ligand-binding sensor domain-containing protein